MAWGQVLGEPGLDETRVAVAAGDLAPDGLVVGTSLFVLSFVDIGDTLSVVEDSGLGVVAALDLEESLVLSLTTLSTLETNKGSFLVQSKPKQLDKTDDFLPHGLTSRDLLLGSNFLSHLYVM